MYVCVFVLRQCVDVLLWRKKGSYIFGAKEADVVFRSFLSFCLETSYSLLTSINRLTHRERTQRQREGGEDEILCWSFIFLQLESVDVGDFQSLRGSRLWEAFVFAKTSQKGGGNIWFACGVTCGGGSIRRLARVELQFDILYIQTTLQGSQVVIVRVNLLQLTVEYLEPVVLGLFGKLKCWWLVLLKFGLQATTFLYTEKLADMHDLGLSSMETMKVSKRRASRSKQYVWCIARGRERRLCLEYGL